MALNDARRRVVPGMRPSPLAQPLTVSVYLVLPIWGDRALPRSNVDDFLPRTLDVNLLMVGQSDWWRARNPKPS